MEAISTKQCRRCFKNKPVVDFGKNQGRQDGLSRWCRECSSAYLANASPERKEERKKSQRQYYHQHKAHLLAQNAEYRTKHREHLMALDRADYEKVRIERRNAGLERIVRKQSGDGLFECMKCHEMKRRNFFYPLSKYSTKLMSYCRACIGDMRQQDYLKRAEIERAQNAVSRLKRKYGMTLEDRDRMLDHQQDCCLACLREFRYASQTDSPHIDHDHTTGKVRGILCGSCNTALGHGRDNPSILRRLATYVERQAA